MRSKRAKSRSARSKSSVKVDWEPAPLKLTRRCVFMSIYGGEGSGKTTLALTAPGPIAFIHASEKFDGIIQPVAADKEVKMFDFGEAFSGKPKGQKEITKAANESISGMKAAWEDAFSWARTIVVDTHTEAWEVLRLARFGGTLTPRGVVSNLYGPVNGEWRRMCKMFRGQNTTNVIAVGQMGEKYRNDKPTGVMKMQGQKEMPYISDIVIRMDLQMPGGFGKKKRSRRPSSSKAKFIATVEKGWHNAMSIGETYEDGEIDFAYIMSDITGSDMEDWE